MKKMFFYAALASVALVSCSKENGVEVPSYNGVNEDAPQAIAFQAGSSFNVTVRGTGVVGGTEAEGNNWKGETLNVYMFEKGKMVLAQNETTGTAYFNNEPVTAPTSDDTGELSYGDTQYYPTSGEFDFFAYYDGSNEDELTPTLNEAGDAYTVDVTIDGTHDLMVAKAGLNADDEDIIADWETENDKNFDRSKVYSAYSARRGVQPRFTFNHLLSRFVFQAVAMEDGAAGENGIKIKKIEVKAPVKGTMTVAALDRELNVKFGETAADSATLELKNRNEAMADATLIKDTPVQLGESMLLPAGGTQYVATIHYEQMKDGIPLKDTYTSTIDLKNGAAFVAGTSYNVNIKVYDFQNIVLTANLTPWNPGEDIPVDSEE